MTLKLTVSNVCRVAKKVNFPVSVAYPQMIHHDSFLCVKKGAWGRVHFYLNICFCLRDFMGVRSDNKSHFYFYAHCRFYTFVAKNGSHDFMTHHFHLDEFYTLLSLPLMMTLFPSKHLMVIILRDFFFSILYIFCL